MWRWLYARARVLAGIGLGGSLVVGCPASEGSSGGSTGELQGTSAAFTTGSGVDGTTGEGSTAGGGTRGETTAVGTTAAPPVWFDLGGVPDAPAPIETCAKVDFLFVIDDSGSMANEQTNLVANFPDFIDGIVRALEGVASYQVGVITTDAYSYNTAQCQALSSLVVQTGGVNSSGSVCGPYAAGANYMTEADALATAFSCAAQVGTAGEPEERPMQALIEAVQRVEGGPGGCNQGFLRDDALLVVVIITDEPDDASPGTPLTWYDDVVAAKLGIPENVVIVSLINTPAGACLGPKAHGIASFTSLFGANGFLAEICALDYAPIFADAVGIIELACENYIPPQ